MFKIGIGVTQFIHYSRFERFHRTGLCLALVVMTRKMQTAVHHHMRPVRLARFVLFLRLARHHRGANHYVAQIVLHRRRNSFRRLERKGEHVGCPAFVTI